MAATQAVSLSANRCSFKDLLFAPIRFCGRQYAWAKSDSEGSVSQIALKTLAMFALVIATFFSVFPALAGAIAFGPDQIHDFTHWNPGGPIKWLKKDINESQLSSGICQNLKYAGIGDSFDYINVKDMGRSHVPDDYFPENTKRRITLGGLSSPPIRWIQIVKNHFQNKDLSQIGGLYSCLRGNGAQEDINRLNDILAVYSSVTFHLALDLAYVRTEVS